MYIKILGKNDITRKLSPEEQAAGENVMKNCLEVKPDETVLIVTDILMEKIPALIFFESAKKFSNRVQMVIMKPTGQHGAEPPKAIAKLIQESQVVLLPTFYSLSHTKARNMACQKGSRIASMPGITKDTILRTLTVGFSETDELSREMAQLLTRAKKAELTSSSGTDMVFNLIKRRAITDVHKIDKGEFGNLPAGEAFIAPVEEEAQGILVFEDCYGEHLLHEPFAVEIKNGLMTKILSTNSTAKKIEAQLNKIGPKARSVAELGIGTNKLAKPGKGLLEVEKIYGTCHVALGNNAFFGGEVDVPYHVDGLIVKPTLKLDGRIIIKNGEILI